MYTRCPQCETSYRLEINHLRSGNGQVKCGRCGSIFDALKTIAETQSEIGHTPGDKVPELEKGTAVQEFSAADDLSADESFMYYDDEHGRRQKKPRLIWLMGITVLSILLCLQIVIINVDWLTANETTRPWLTKFCKYINCPLSTYRNVNQLELLGHSLHKTPERVFEFKLLLANHAPFPQPYPPIRLTLLQFNGAAMASRIIFPDEYLSGQTLNTLMPTATPQNINIQIAQPKKDVGGYNFQIL